MKKFLENLAALVKVKTVITFVVMLVFAVLALNGKIPADNTMIIISMVVSFYFGTQNKQNSATPVVISTAPSATPVAVVTEQTTPFTASVDNFTYSQTHPDSK